MIIEELFIPYKDYLSRFKQIRKEKNIHLGEYTLAKDKTRGANVAIKKHEGVSENELTEIIQALSGLLRLNACQNIIPLIGYTTTRSTAQLGQHTVYLIYEHLSPSLFDDMQVKMRQGQPFPESSLWELLENMLNALAEISSLNARHGDIGPKNIMLFKNDLKTSFKLSYTSSTVSSLQQILHLQ